MRIDYTKIYAMRRSTARPANQAKPASKPAVRNRLDVDHIYAIRRMVMR